MPFTARLQKRLQGIAGGGRSITFLIREAILKALAKERTARHKDIATFLSALLIPPFSKTDSLAPMLCLPQRQGRSTDPLQKPKLENSKIATPLATQGNIPGRQQPLEMIFATL